MIMAHFTKPGRESAKPECFKQRWKRYYGLRLIIVNIVESGSFTD